jgi:hypothetical protein
VTQAIRFDPGSPAAGRQDRRECGGRGEGRLDAARLGVARRRRGEQAREDLAGGSDSRQMLRDIRHGYGRAG